MNAGIETLNHWGESFLGFAWPMFWQSSLLIVVVFALDWVFARKIRASVRYALWMVVLVKLLLPPALALPTGAAWWLWRAQPPVPVMPVVKNYTVSFDESALPDNYVPPAVPIVLPSPKLSAEALAMIAVAAVSAGLLLWLLFRWLRVAGRVRRVERSDVFANALADTRQLARLRKQMRLKLIDEPLSPAVYGLFRPVILLPRALAEKLSDRQLRAVLLHEAIHLRRGDVWVNCAQALLQIAYWWHPLLWLANARIRRVREEAVDDAVMAALRDSSDTYAPTLLEVAKFAFRRPLASLGLVGILESRSALRQRIERLVDFRPPRRAGITFLSLCGIFAFSAVALPMGQGPTSTTDSFSADMGPGEKTLTVKVDPEIFIRNLKAKADWVMESDTNDYGDILLNILNGEGVDFTVPHEIAFDTKTGEITARNTPEQLEIFQRVVEQLNRADGKYDLSSSPNRLHRKRVLFQGQFFWMTAEDFKKLAVDATYHGSLGGSAAHWTANVEQFDQIQKQIKRLGLTPFMRPRVETFHGCAADFYCGTHTNWVTFDCYPLVYDDGITLAFRAESDLVSMQDGLDVTNRSEVYGKETVDNNGGLVVAAENADGSPTNLVVLIHVKTVEETPRSVPTGGGEGAANQNIMTQVFQIENPVRDEDLKSLLQDAGVKIPPTIVVYVDNGSILVRGTADQLALVEQVVGKLNRVSPKPAHSVFTSQGREAIYSKLNRIRLDTVSYKDLPLSEVIRNLRELSQQNGPDKTRINFVYDPNIESTPATAAINPGTGLPVTAPAAAQHADSTQININLRLTNVSLVDLLNAICLTSDHPIKYSVEDYGVVFSPKGTNAPQYEMRTFKVDARAFYSNLLGVSHSFQFDPVNDPANAQSIGGPPPKAGTNVGPNMVTLAKQFFSNLGVNLDPPKQIYFTHRLGVLFVYATPKDLEVIERAIQVLNEPAPAAGNNAAPSQVTRDLGTIQNTEENGITQQTESGLNQALTEEHREAHMNLVAPAEINSPQQHSRPVINPVTGLPAFTWRTPNSSKGTNILKLRAFGVDTKAIVANLEKATGQKASGTNVYVFLKQLIENKGVDLSPPKTIEFNEEHGVLFVRATEKDLDVIEREITVLNQEPTQIHIKARFLEVPKTLFADAPPDCIPANMTNGLGLLTNPQLRAFLHYAESQKGTKELAEPEVTTIVGRQTKIRATVMQEVVTNYSATQNVTGTNPGVLFISPQLTKVETGPILDVIPVALADGHTLGLDTTASRIQFFGYASPKGLPFTYATNSATGDKATLPASLPVIQISQAQAQMNIYDGQTIVLFPKPGQLLLCASDTKSEEVVTKHIQEAEHQYGDKVLIALVTATLVDPAGNRVHSDGEIPFAQTDFPPQSQ